MATLLGAKRIGPGEKGYIQASLDTKGLRNTVKKVITVSTNDPRTPLVVLTIVADVEREFILSQREIDFGRIDSSSGRTRELTISQAADRGSRVLRAESSLETAKVRLEPVNGSDGHQMRVIVSLRERLLPGYYFGFIVVHTSSPYIKEIRIAYRGRIIG
jgi:hypothetical protein